MKKSSRTERIVQPGVFTGPSGAKLWSAVNPESAAIVWRELGPFLAYPKPDGWRFQVHKIGETIKIFTRSEKEWSKKFPGFVSLLSSRLLVDQAILDIELVGFDGADRRLQAASLLNSKNYYCSVLDALQLGEENLTSLPTSERLSIIQDRLKGLLHDKFSLAEYRHIRSEDEWQVFYQSCLARLEEGFDGAIVKLLDAPYFTPVYKVKPEEPIDAVVVGIYRGKKNKRGEFGSLLLAAPDQKRKLWAPIGKVGRKSAAWDVICKACETLIADERPDNVEAPVEAPDIWITPRVVVSATFRPFTESKNYKFPVALDAIKNCTLREDKSAEDATSFDQVLELAGYKQDEKRPSLFDP